MEEEELKKLWSASVSFQKVEMDVKTLTENVVRRISVFERTVRRRNWLEVTVTGLMIPYFGWRIVATTSLLGKVGAIIICLGCLLVIVRLFPTRGIKKDVATSIDLQSFLVNSLVSVRHEIRLLDTVLWWYISPFFIGVTCFYWSLSASYTNKAIYTSICILLSSFIYYLNKIAIKRNLRPIEKRLTEALSEITSTH